MGFGYRVLGFGSSAGALPAGIALSSGGTTPSHTQNIDKILMTSTDVKFYQNDSLIHTCNSTSGSGSSSQVPDASKTYYMIGASSNASATLEGVNPTLTGKLGSENIIYEESDTGKHYIWDGSSTWNEIA